MTTVLTLVVSILVFGVVVLVHEWGHFMAARRSGVHVDEFSIGFGPAIWQKTKNGTVYSIRIIPLGGYNAISEAGLSIPEDVSVMGYDGIFLSRVVKPQLVTYQQNTTALGRTAADKLIELIEHPRVTLPEQIRVSGKLLDGGSVSIL